MLFRRAGAIAQLKLGLGAELALVPRATQAEIPSAFAVAARVDAKADLTQEAAERAAALMKAKKARAVKELESVTINLAEVTNEGASTLEFVPGATGESEF